MTVAQSVASNLPALRRFARALSGSQESGDAYVVAVLEALAKDVTIFPRDMEPKVALFHLLLKIWDSVDLNAEPSAPPDASRPMRRLQRLTPKPRQALLLLAVEGFDPEAIAQILDTDVDDVASLIERADEEVARQLGNARVMIIEDEPMTASYLEELVASLGHNVVGVARTHEQAIKMSEETDPDLILSDIQLADGSSGITAVNQILSSAQVPVIFVTGHPDMLLTGSRPEPTFLIPKPFNARTIKAVLGQALLFEVRSRPAASPVQPEVFS